MTTEEIIQIRKTFNVSQDIFAKLIGIGIASIRRYESSTYEHTPSQLTIYKILQNRPEAIKCFWEVNGEELNKKEYERAKKVLAPYIGQPIELADEIPPAETEEREPEDSDKMVCIKVDGDRIDYTVSKGFAQHELHGLFLHLANDTSHSRNITARLHEQNK